MTDTASSSISMPLILLADEVEVEAATVAIAGAVTGAVTDTTTAAAAGAKGVVVLRDCCARGSVVGSSRRLLVLPVAPSTFFCSLTEDAASDLLTASGVSLLIDLVSELSFSSGFCIFAADTDMPSNINEDDEVDSFSVGTSAKGTDCEGCDVGTGFKLSFIIESEILAFDCRLGADPSSSAV